MEYLQNLLDNSSLPVVTAFLLGLLTAISPCPLATNIATIGYLSKDIANKRQVFRNGLLYTLGRIVAYSLLGIILIAVLRKGTSLFPIEKALGKWSELLLAPLLVLVGLFMLFGSRINLPKFGFLGNGERITRHGGWGALLLGMLFALAFCPTSGIFYFGMLIPMSVVETGGYLLPAVFAVATGLPVVVVAWLLAYSVAGVGRFYNRIQSIQRWLTRIVAVLFIVIGIFYGIIYFG